MLYTEELSRAACPHPNTRVYILLRDPKMPELVCQRQPSRGNKVKRTNEKTLVAMTKSRRDGLLSKAPHYSSARETIQMFHSCSLSAKETLICINPGLNYSEQENAVRFKLPVKGGIR